MRDLMELPVILAEGENNGVSSCKSGTKKKLGQKIQLFKNIVVNRYTGAFNV
jgi:hypothetical protein